MVMDNVLLHNGFVGTYSFSEEDGVFYGKIEGIKGLVSFEGKTMQDLEQDFKDAVNSYIEYCKRDEIQSMKSYSGDIK